MKIPIDRINSVGIRAEMHRDSYQFADFLGTFLHPDHPERGDWCITLYRAADTLVFETNGDPVWETNGEDFKALATEYGIDVDALVRGEEGSK